MSTCRDITLTVLGGGGEIGASCFQVHLNGSSVLLDCGFHPKKEGFDALPQLERIREAPKALFVSHGHHDHIGSIPLLLRRFPNVKIFSTPPTYRIMDRMLHNSVTVMETVARERGIEAYPLFNHSDVKNAMQCVRPKDMDEPFMVPMDVPLEVEFLYAGHVLGSASLLLRTPDHTLLYTGDICERPQELMDGLAPWTSQERIHTLIIESTHGATSEAEYPSYEAELLRLGEAIAAVLRRNGCVLIPSFALGRTQEVINALARLQEEGLIPFVPIHVSGLGRAIYEIYDQYVEYLKPDANLRPLDLFERIGNVFDPHLLESLVSRPCIIVATSGMMFPNTPSAVIAERLVQETHHGIFFVGYLDADSLGYRLLHAQPGEKLQFQTGQPEVEIKLENIQRFYLSSHAFRNCLRRFIERVNPKNVVFVHGDPDALEWMRTNGANGCHTFVPNVGDTVVLRA